ncbi:MAG: hypothetical protein COW19_03795 [Zetaproteobacteria bacterium CG12_big_fil_rev_8_21_14_0_65_55_1124]|nr:MAG: hypothetical protein AUJ58_09205 [Zetaproteobacteria bacterium CG1_02_55_237]PIS18671.1 MAG: hypothetical protein COT53_09685 [Zetaproteobacteria bacterium CG08_land_8_20_14_0_20_55_17]PIW43275.1 MAG: hypothetical protein COW19_03795 [Zetaproteobacteria bacterium CG12_big_fil_rev_8_21_14_0_65_55_1124]PIY53406.1 MAG: hypothetical protein COZ01_04030 [Zetaproteobacteria bacterium CG_4_10_14_0_8_um_filter_55_43]PIZ38691.1 MAG: hypothetical protein COY36_05465 [Zetaproteobacteria bacterium 
MFPVSAAQLLNLPEGAASNANQRLPWTNGSLLSAKLSPTDTAGVAQLVLGGYTLRAQVPPTTTMGKVWLLLINHEMPAQFRLLSDAEAVRALSQMLHKSATTRGDHATAKQTQEHGWNKLETDSLPFTADVSKDGQNVFLRDRNNGRPHVVLNKSADSDRFYIQGRVDLEHLGPVVFTLEGGAERAWWLRMFAANPQFLPPLRTNFDTWLHDKQTSYTNLGGELLRGLPDNLSALADSIRA